MPSPLQARTRIVQSPANQWVKALRAAVARPPSLALFGEVAASQPLLALEGFHLVSAALEGGLAPAVLFLREGEEVDTLESLQRLFARPGKETRAGASAAGIPLRTELLVLPKALFAQVLATETPQPIAALVPAPHLGSGAVVEAANPLVLVLAGLQDPGNVGTLLRSAEAFGATGALLLTGTATPWNPKCLRASAGSALRLPLMAVESAAAAAEVLGSHGILSYAAVVRGGNQPGDAPLGRPAALWIGNEGAGLTASELAACDRRISLLMPGKTESLNAAVAGSLLLYEAARVRAGRTAA